MAETKEINVENPAFSIIDEKWAHDMQVGLEEYMMLLYTSVESLEGDDPEWEDFDTESGILFCGCNVCEYREILSYITPRVIKGYKEGKVTLSTEEPEETLAAPQ